MFLLTRNFAKFTWLRKTLKRKLAVHDTQSLFVFSGLSLLLIISALVFSVRVIIAMFTPSARRLVPRHRHKIDGCVRILVLQVRKYHLVPRYKVGTFYPGMDTVPEIWGEYLGVHISPKRESYSSTVLGHQV